MPATRSGCNARRILTNKAVRSHIQSIYGKLGIRSRSQPVARTREANLLWNLCERQKDPHG